jgi:hypothetical protein
VVEFEIQFTDWDGLGRYVVMVPSMGGWKSETGKDELPFLRLDYEY